MIKVLHFVSKMDRAGQETLIMNIYRNIDREKIQFCFLCSVPEKGDYDDEIYSLGGQIYILPRNMKTGHLSRYLSEIRNIENWLKKNKGKYDIVHLHTYHALDVWVHLEACRRAGVKNIFVHSHNTNGPHLAVHKIMRKICRLYHYTKFACSAEAGVWLYGEKVFHSGEVTIVYNGIDISNFQYDAVLAKKYKEKFHLEGKTVIGHIGRFNYQKNHEFLIDIFECYIKKNPQAVLILVGRGELEENIKSKVSSLGLQESVMFLGIREDIPQLLNCFDIMIFPSWYEGLSVAFVEAQMNGLYVVANENTTPEAIISEGVKVLPLGDAEMWSDCAMKFSGKRTEQIKGDKFDIRRTTALLEARYMKAII